MPIFKSHYEMIRNVGFLYNTVFLSLVINPLFLKHNLNIAIFHILYCYVSKNFPNELFHSKVELLYKYLT